MRAILLLMIILLAASAVAYTDLETDSHVCFRDGSFSFNAWNGKPDELLTNSIEMELEYQNTKELVPVSGTWSKEAMRFFHDDPERKQSNFTSDTGVMDLRGDYRLKMKYEGCRESRCFEYIHFDNCPGLDQRCVDINPVVESCASRSSEAIVTFSVDKPREIRLPHDFRYYFKSNFHDRLGVDSIPGLRVEMENGEYRAIVPLRDGEILTEAAIAYKKCDPPATLNKLVSCTELEIEDAPEPEVEEEIKAVKKDEPRVEPKKAEPVEEPVAVDAYREEPQQFFSMPFVILAIAIAIGIIWIIIHDRKV